MTSFDILSVKNYVNVPSKSNQQKTFWKISFLLASWGSMTKIAGSGSISQRHGSADPEPHQMSCIRDTVGKETVWNVGCKSKIMRARRGQGCLRKIQSFSIWLCQLISCRKLGIGGGGGECYFVTVKLDNFEYSPNCNTESTETYHPLK